MLFYATIFTTLALVFYAVGVWAEKKRLKYWYIYLFWGEGQVSVVRTFFKENTQSDF